MTDLTHFIAVSSLVVIGFILVSRRLRYLPLSAPMIALAAGILAGPEAFALFSAEGLAEPMPLLIEAARLTVGVNLLAAALRLRKSDLRQLAAPVALLLTVGMLLMAGISGGLVWWISGSGLLIAAVIGAAMAPTDPVVANTIVTGDLAKASLPRHTRSALTLESGVNDGLAYPLVMLPIALMENAAPAAALTHWVLRDILIALGVAVVLGWAVGWAGAAALRLAKARKAVGKYSLLSYTVALSLFAVYGVHAIGGDGLLAVFVAGLAFTTHMDEDDEEKLEAVQEGIGKLFTLPVFLLLGAALPWHAWAREGWGLLIGLAVAVLLLRRLPMWLLLWPLLKRWFAPREGLFLGWFGPIGVAPLFYVTHTHHLTGEAVIWTLGSFVIVASVVVHGVTSATFTKAFGRREQQLSHRRDD